MKKIFPSRLFWITFISLFPFFLKAQNPTYLLELRNDVQVSSKVYEFDIYLLRTGTTPIEYASGSYGITINPLIKNLGGTITASMVVGSPDPILVSSNQTPNTISFYDPTNVIRISGRAPPGAGNGAQISNISPGTRICRVRLSNTVDFAQDEPDLTWTTTAYPTAIYAYVEGTSIPITNTSNHTTNNLINPTLNTTPPPTAFSVTGTGSYCEGSGGLAVGLSGSEAIVTYTLYKDGVPQAPTVTGTGSAISFGNQLEGLYTVKGTSLGGTTDMTGSAVLTENPNATILLTSGTSTQTVCINSPITNIVYAIGGGGTLASATGLPLGLTGNFNSGNFTISGSPSQAGTFNYTVNTTGTCTQTSATGTITVKSIQTANAGPDQVGSALCGLTSTTLAGNTPTEGTGSWSIVSGAGGNISTPTSPTSGFSGTAGTTYVLRWTISNSPCTASTEDVTITFPRNPTTANAGPDQVGSALCGLTSTTLAGNTPSIGTGSWSIFSGAGGNISAPTSPTSGFSGTAGTTYVLRWTISNSPCTASTEDVTITFPRNPTTAVAGPDQVGSALCGLTSTTLAGNTPTDGTGSWSIFSGAGGNISTPASPTSGFSGTAGTTYVLRWTISNSPCTASTEDVTITFPRNPTTANAGPDQVGSALCGLTSTTLAGNTPSIGTGSWSIFSGAGGNISAPTSPTSGFSGTAGTTYVLRWTISNSPCTASTEDVTITFPRNPTTAVAGPDQVGSALCGLTSTTLAGNTPTDGTGSWSIFSGAGGNISTPASPTSGFSGTAGTTYVLRWTISNSPCTASTEDVTITFPRNPTTANAGPDQVGSALCGLTSTTLAGNTPSIGTGSWSIFSGAGGNISAPTSPTSGFSGTAGTTYVLRWTISNSPCTASTEDVTITFPRNPTTAVAGPDQVGSALCGLTSTTLAGNTPTDGTGSWSIFSGAGGNISTPASPTSGFSGTAGTTYVLRWTISNSPCTASTEDVTITFPRNPTTANAGPDQVGSALCGLTSTTLAGNTPSIGTGSWSIFSGAGGNISAPTSPTSGFSGTAGTTYVLRWTISNSPCTASTEDVTITFPRNPTTAVAGPDQVGSALCGLTSTTLAGNTPTDGTGSWSIFSGAGGNISTPASPTSGFSGTAGTTYVLRWTISNSPCTASTEDVTITFPRNPTTANAGPDQVGSALCGLTSTTLAGNTPSIGTGSWSIFSGAGGNISTPTSPTSGFSGTAGTTYVLRWTISNSPCTASTEDVTITFPRNPTTANAGPDQVGSALCGLTSTTLAGNTPTDGTGSWSIFSGAGGNISTPASPTSGFSGTAGTTYVLRWTISNSPCTASTEDVTITFPRNPTTANAGPDQVGSALCGLTSTTLAGNTPSIGTGSWSIFSGAGGNISAPTSPTSGFSGTAGTTYVLRWTISNSPCTASTEDVTITFPRNPTTAVAGPDQVGSALCGLTSTTLAGNTPTDGTGSWSIFSGAGGNISTPASPTSGFSGTAGTTYVLRWTISNSPCTASTEDVTITFPRNPTTANAGTDQIGSAMCGLTSTTLAGNIPTEGNGTWSIVSGAGGTITTPTSPTSGFSGTAGTTYVLRWTISNSPCTATTDDVTITFLALPPVTLSSNDSDNIFCQGTTVQFIAGGGVLYNFKVGGVSVQNGPSNTYTTSTLTNGQTVSVTATSSEGCVATSPEKTNFVNDLPFIVVSGSPVCAPDLLTYSLEVTVSPGTVTTAPAQNVVNISGNIWRINNVPSGTNIIVSVSNINNCVSTVSITAPNCSCPVIQAPVSGGDKSYCEGGTIPTLNVTVAAGETADWYSAPSAGTLLRSGSLSYTPNNAGTYYVLARNISSSCVSSVRTAVTVIMNPLPVPSLSSSDSDNEFCAGTSIIFTAEGGTNFNFRVNGSSVQNGLSDKYTTSSLTNNQIVNVIVTNSNQCSATSAGITNRVYVLPVPTITSSETDNSFCAGTSVMFTAGGGSSYNFRVAGVSVQTGASNKYTTISLTNNQVVDVIVTGPGGCSVTSAGITNSVSSLPVPTLISSETDNTICAGTSVTFTAGGGTNYNFRVGGVSKQSGPSNTYSTSSLTNNQIVDVIVTNDNGCSATSSGITTAVYQVPVANGGPGGSVCDLDFVLHAVPSVGTGTWTQTSGTGTSVFTPGASSANATVAVTLPGTYIFTWTEVNNGCSSSSAVTVNFYRQPVAEAGTGGTNCGPVFRLSAIPSVGTGTWTRTSGPGSAVFAPNANTATANVTVSAYGTYTFRWTEVNGTCSANESITVSFLQAPTPIAGADASVCDLKHTLNAVPGSGAGAGTWSVLTGPGAAVFTPDATHPDATVSVDEYGTYDFAWTEVNGSCLASDVVRVIFRSLPPLLVSRDTMICRDGSIQLTATGTGTFHWTPSLLVNNPDIASPVVIPVDAEYFVVTLTNQFGCVSKDSVFVDVWDQPVAFAGPDTTLNYIFTLKMDGDALKLHETGLWTLESGSALFSDILSPETNVTGLSTGENILLWTVTNGICPPSSDYISITVNDFVVPTLITPNGDPNNEYFVLRGLETLGKTAVVIFDRRGAQVYKNDDYTNDWNGLDYNGNPLPDDTYFYTIRSQNGTSMSGYLVVRR